MQTELDASEFIDHEDLPPSGTPSRAHSMNPHPHRAPSREEVDLRVADMQQKLDELRRTQQELERQRTALEETRRRQAEYGTSREEMLHHLTRGVGLLEEAEFAHRREAEQMSKSLIDLKEMLIKVQSLNESSWTQENLQVELTRALTTLENARMEWNSARLKFPVLSEDPPSAQATPGPSHRVPILPQSPADYAEWCKLGLALTWPIAVAALAIFLLLLFRG